MQKPVDRLHRFFVFMRNLFLFGITQSAIHDSASTKKPPVKGQRLSPYIYSHCNAVMAIMSTTSCTLQPRDKSLTGLAMPCKIGPIAVAPAKRCTNL